MLTSTTTKSSTVAVAMGGPNSYKTHEQITGEPEYGWSRKGSEQAAARAQPLMMQKHQRRGTSSGYKRTACCIQNHPATVQASMALTFSAMAESSPRSMQVAVCDSHAYTDVAQLRFQSRLGSAASKNKAVLLLLSWNGYAGTYLKIESRDTNLKAATAAAVPPQGRVEQKPCCSSCCVGLLPACKRVAAHELIAHATLHPLLT